MADQSQQTTPIAPIYPPSGPRASFGERLAAILVDVILLVIVMKLIGLALGDDPLAYTSTGPNSAVEFTANDVTLFVAGTVCALYFSFLDGSGSGQTLGKSLLKIRVVDFTSGAPIGFGRGLLRCFGRLLSCFFCFLGYFWMLWDGDKQTWHDKMAATTVVPTSAFPVEKWPG